MGVCRASTSWGPPPFWKQEATAVPTVFGHCSVINRCLILALSGDVILIQPAKALLMRDRAGQRFHEPRLLYINVELGLGLLKPS